ncbi:MAG: polysaccharide deacetylase [Myxococcota bacterium]|nr:polysaccharide deacetylase [Myxococcota bacterium]
MAAQDPVSSPAAIERYQPVFEGCRGADRQSVAIRAYRQGDVDYRLTVDPHTLRTRLEKASALECDADPGNVEALLSGTPYRRALDVERESEHLVQDAGIVRSLTPVTGYFLTVDLCPSSKKGFNQKMFETLEHASEVHGTAALPVALAVSGRWMKTHPEAFAWLREEAVAGRLQVTWVNHTLSHPYDSHLDLAHNFMRETGIDPLAEILGLEKLLLGQGITPSVFFRFPGLVSSPELMHIVEGLHLVTVGSDAWLAKGQQPKLGSAILIHGNLNEPAGVKLMLEWVARQKKDSIYFLPLESIAGTGRDR